LNGLLHGPLVVTVILAVLAVALIAVGVIGGSRELRAWWRERGIGPHAGSDETEHPVMRIGPRSRADVTDLDARGYDGPEISEDAHLRGRRWRLDRRNADDEPKDQS